MEKIHFLASGGFINHVKKVKLVEEIQRQNNVIKVIDRSPTGWDIVHKYLPDNFASDLEVEKQTTALETKGLVKRKGQNKNQTVSLLQNHYLLLIEITSFVPAARFLWGGTAALHSNNTYQTGQSTPVTDPQKYTALAVDKHDS